MAPPIDDARLPCCGQIPEKVFQQWHPHDPTTPCRPYKVPPIAGPEA